MKGNPHFSFFFFFLLVVADLFILIIIAFLYTYGEKFCLWVFHSDVVNAVKRCFPVLIVSGWNRPV